MLNSLFRYSDNRKAYLVVSALAFVVYMVTAYANYGYHHADELYQIIEYAGMKSETFTPMVAWEYDAQIRPMLQPTICLAFLDIFKMLSVTDPYIQALIMRFFAAAISFIAILAFVGSTAGRITNPKHRIVYLALSLLMWFLPYISCRFSSETFGAIFLLFALAIYFTNKNTVLIRTLFGICLALSFIFRFQMGLAILGFGIWALIIDKRDWRFFIVPALSFIATYMALGIGVDSWYYGEFVFVPYKYVKVNSEISADWFGSEPWWYYLDCLVSYPTYWIGVPLAAAILYLLIRNPKNPYLWCLIPFFVVHSLIDHKESRFLFPMAFLVPAILMSAFEQINQKLERKKLWRIFCYVLLSLFSVVNVVGLGVNMTKPAGQQTCYLAKYIRNNYGGEKVNIIHGLYANPYGPYGGISGFYKNDNATMQEFNNIYGMKLLLKPDAVNFFTCRKCDLEDMVCVGEFADKNPFEVLKSIGFEYVSQSMPKFSEKICENYSAYDDCDMIYVFRYIGEEYMPKASDYKEAVFFFSDCEQSGMSEMSYSGNCSSLVYGEKCYSVTIVDSVSKLDNVEDLSVSMFLNQADTVPDALVVLEMLGKGDMKLWDCVGVLDKTSKTNQWVNISVDFKLPDNYRDYSIFKVYLYNPSDTKIYCDDIFAVFYRSEKKESPDSDS